MIINSRKETVMYLRLNVKIPSDSAGITCKKSMEVHTFIMHMNVITLHKRDIRFLKAYLLVSALMSRRNLIMQWGVWEIRLMHFSLKI